MSESETDPVAQAVARVRSLIAEAQHWLDSWPESRSEHSGWLYVFTELLREVVTLFIPLADAYITPLHVSPAPYNAHLETFHWIHYCKSWCSSVRLLADRNVYHAVTYRIREKATPTPGIVLNYSHVIELRRNVNSIVGSEELNAAFRARDEMNPRWKTQPPSAGALLISLEARRQAWRVTELAILLVELLNIYHEHVRTYCDMEAEEQAQAEMEASKQIVNGVSSDQD